MLYVEKTIPEHCFLLAPNLKPLDRYEIALWGLDPLQALLQPFRYSRPNVNSFTILTKEHKVAAIFGAVPSRIDNKIGTIWFLSSTELDKNYLYFLKRNKKWLHYLEEHYIYLSNYITEEHTKSIRWLKWQGYNFSKPMLVKNVKVLYFYKRLHDVVKKGTQPLLEEIGPLWTTELI
jgi:hypothetical protein|tara:strand:- start:269 stop:799 length:531 start_codon:yes stop_codon:yes gene_type:complete